jgi:hypothetical protein
MFQRFVCSFAKEESNNLGYSSGGFEQLSLKSRAIYKEGRNNEQSINVDFLPSVASEMILEIFVSNLMSPGVPAQFEIKQYYLFYLTGSQIILEFER